MSLYDRSALKRKVASLFSRFFLSNEESKKLKEMVRESDAIYKRLDEQEYSIREMNKINAKLNNTVRKEIKEVLEKTLQIQIQQEKSFNSKISELRSDIVMYATSESKELKKLVLGSDAVCKRLDEQEYLVCEMNKINAKLNNAVRKEIKGVLKKTLQIQMQQEKSFDSIISGLSSDIVVYTTQSKLFHSTAAFKVDEAVGRIAGVNGAITGIRDYLEENSKTAKRFQEGYDYHILKHFVRQMATTIRNLDRAISKQDNGNAKEELIDARDDLVELLSFNGVVQITPPIGASRQGIEKDVEVVQERAECDNPALSGMIAEIVQVGYKFTFNEDQERVILPARVKLFV